VKARTKAGSRRSSEAVASVTLAVRIQPRASKNGVTQLEDGTVKIRLTAPPVDGAANEALVEFLSKTLSVSKSAVEIVSGHASREKRVKISGMGEADVTRLLNIDSQ
jgi:uncharacterized protein (TIGR00251 family)